MKKSLLTLIAFFTLSSGLALAAPRTIDDCEKIADPDSYNRCLASFGPAARNRGAATQAAPAAAQTEAAAEPARPARSRVSVRSKRRYAGKAYRSRRGRVRMEFRVGRGGRAAVSKRYRRYRR